MMLRKLIDTVLFWALVALMSFMTLNVLWQVASRYLMSSPSSFTDELARYLLIWVGLLGASYVTGKKLHLAIDILPSKLTGTKERNLNIVINMLVAIFALLVMVWGGIKLVYITLTLEQTSASLNVPLGYVYSVLPLSGILIVYYSIANLFEKRPEAEVVGKEMF
ncbi:TRAP transporter small permease subunit [Flammeovirgaceae bacterium 311]|nr:TRAP transporter small permease subunit [Flammeovirgaceae bacterium 311]